MTQPEDDGYYDDDDDEHDDANESDDGEVHEPETGRFARGRMICRKGGMHTKIIACGMCIFTEVTPCEFLSVFSSSSNIAKS